jgi:predicted HTH transcriptional regulator
VPPITDADIISRLTNVEDATVERKTSSDYRDVAKAATAFSNSMPLGEPGIIYVGVYNDGRIEELLNPEKLQKNVSGEIGNVYPPIYPQILVREKDGKKFVAVIVQGSANRPHFAGKSYLRDGTRTVPASAEMFQELIDQRSSKTNEISKWVGKSVLVNTLLVEQKIGQGFDRVRTSRERVIRACNQFYVTLDADVTTGIESVALRRIEISFDYGRNCLILEVSAL